MLFTSLLKSLRVMTKCLYFHISLPPGVLVWTEDVLFVVGRSHTKVAIEPSLLYNISVFITISIILVTIFPVIPPLSSGKDLILRVVQRQS